MLKVLNIYLTYFPDLLQGLLQKYNLCVDGYSLFLGTIEPRKKTAGSSGCV